MIVAYHARQDEVWLGGARGSLLSPCQPRSAPSEPPCSATGGWVR